MLSDISTHILTRRMTELNEARKNYGSISTHILTKRMTIFNISKLCCAVISTHILTKRMTVYHAFWIPRCIFQLTSSRRGWLLNPYYQALGINISTHILTKRMTDSLFCQDFFVFYFNSHPHEEDDKNRKFYERGLVSFQLTSSRRGWRVKDVETVNQLIFQLTSSRRGWQHLLFRTVAQGIFQLTSSRRGWRDFHSYDELFTGYFNSHPHEEDDLRLSISITTFLTFQLTSSRRGWRM